MASQKSNDYMAIVNQALDQAKKLGFQDGKETQDYVSQCIDRYDRMIKRDSERAKQESEERDKRLANEHAMKMKQLEYDEKIRTEKMKIEHEESMKKMELDRLKIEKEEIQSDGTWSSRMPKLNLKPFDPEKDRMDVYLQKFSDLATKMGIKQEDWPLVLSSLLEGEAAELYFAISGSSDFSYKILKEGLLQKYECNSEGFRRRFRDAKPKSDEPFSQFSIRIRHLAERWAELDKIPKTYDGLLDLFLREKFQESVSPELKTYINEQEPKKLEDMTVIADRYRNARPYAKLSNDKHVQFTNVASYSHGSSSFNNVGRGQQGNTRYNFLRGRGRTTSNRAQTGHLRQQTESGRGRGFPQRYNSTRDTQGPQQNSNVICFYCHRTGHIQKECWHLQNAHMNAITTDTDAPQPNNFQNFMGSTTHIVCSLKDEFSGDLHLHRGKVNGRHASVLRDTGATICGVRAGLVDKDQYLGRDITCVSFGGRKEVFPIAEVDIETDFFVGKIQCCVINNPAADLILGNIPNMGPPIQPNNYDKTQSILVTTRAQVQKNKIPKVPLHTVTEDLKLTKKDLSEFQRQDNSLTDMFSKAKQGTVSQTGNATVSYFVENEILFRNYKNEKDHINQIVVPQKLRSSVLATAHDLLISGHCGNRRTRNRILKNFFWPGIFKDVKDYVRTSLQCQKAAPKGRIKRLPLFKTPIITTPFHRVGIDLVGPFSPASEEGHRYVLTVICLATRYPEGIPLKFIDSVTVAEALFTIFTRVGFPVEILSDRGSQFNSDLMKQFQRLLGIHGITCTPYHPQNNGCCERLHGTLKAMLRKTIQSQPKSWHRYLPALLFACRELPNESTHYSPFELLFGRQPRGPISILAEIWTDSEGTDENAKELYPYVFELKKRISETMDMACNNEAQAAETRKKYRDQTAEERSFEVGEEVLLLLPSTTNKLLMEWKGPYQVIENCHPDYKIKVKNMDKLFHANLLKKFHRRNTIEKESITNNDVKPSPNIPWADITTFEPETKYTEKKTKTQVANTLGVIDDTQDDGIEIPTPPSRITKEENIEDVKFDPNLTQERKQQILSLFQEFQHILTTIPGTFSGDLMHSVPLTSNVPVRKKPYDLPFASKQIVEDEIKYMLELGIIEPAISPYSSPVVLAKKKDYSTRFCIDFRGLNIITVADAEPIPDIEMMFIEIAQSCFFTKFDLSKGFWQIVLDPADKHKTAFSTHLGLFQWTRMPFGLISAPATFSRMMRMLDLEKFSAFNFYDDVLVHGHDWEQHVQDVRGVLKQLDAFHLTVRPSKIEAGFQQVEFLGHKVGRGTLQPHETNLNKMMNIPTPKSKKQVRSVLGLLNYYRRYIPHFATLVTPLTELTKENGKRSIKWTKECESALRQVQILLGNKPILQLPRISEPFLLRTDASATGVGAILLQESDGKIHPTAFASRKLLDRETRYSTIERECLAIVWGISKFSRFLWGTHFTLETDHKPLTYLCTSEFKNSRLMRWSMSLQEYSFTIKSLPGTSNTFADFLSRSEENQCVI